MVFQSFWSHLFSSYKSLDKALPLEAVGSKVFPKVVGEVIKVTLEAVKSSCIKKSPWLFCRVFSGHHECKEEEPDDVGHHFV